MLFMGLFRKWMKANRGGEGKGVARKVCLVIDGEGFEALRDASDPSVNTERHVMSRRSIAFISVRMHMEVPEGRSIVSWRVVWGWRSDVRKGKVGRFTLCYGSGSCEHVTYPRALRR